MKMINYRCTRSQIRCRTTCFMHKESRPLGRICKIYIRHIVAKSISHTYNNFLLSRTKNCLRQEFCDAILWYVAGEVIMVLPPLLPRIVRFHGLIYANSWSFQFAKEISSVCVLGCHVNGFRSYIHIFSFVSHLNWGRLAVVGCCDSQFICRHYVYVYLRCHHCALYYLRLTKIPFKLETNQNCQHEIDRDNRNDYVTLWW